MDRSTGQTVAHTTDRAENREERISLSDIHHRPHCLRLGVKSQPGTAGKNPSSLPCCALSPMFYLPLYQCLFVVIGLQASSKTSSPLEAELLWPASTVLGHNSFYFSIFQFSLSLWHLSQVFHNVTKNALHGIMSFVNGHPSPQFTLGHKARCVQSSTLHSLDLPAFLNSCLNRIAALTSSLYPSI